MYPQTIKTFVITICSFIFFPACYAQENYVVRITASNCIYSDEPGTTNVLTGFFLKGKGIITALHGVCGCKTIAAEDSDGRDLGRITISLVDLENDVALLSSERGMSFNLGFEFSDILPSTLGGQNVTMIGYGHKVAKPKVSAIAKVRRPALRALRDCIKPEHKEKLLERNSPNIYNQVLDVEIQIPR